MKLAVSLFLFLVLASGLYAQSYTIELKEIKKKAKTPKQYEISISYPQIKGLNNSSQDGFNKMMTARMNAEKDSFEVWMKDWEVMNHQPDMGSYYDVNDTVLYMDSKVISVICYVDTYFEGAAHPGNWSFSINYDLIKNKEVKLSDVFTGDYVKFFSQYCIKDITKQKKDNYAPELTDPDEFTLDGAGPKEENFKVFNPTKEGFLITFPTYQVGAYVEGPMEVLIPYNLLKDYVKTGSPLESFVK
jgi:hypothetical protein